MKPKLTSIPVISMTEHYVWCTIYQVNGKSRVIVAKNTTMISGPYTIHNRMTQWCIYWLGISSITRPPFSGSSQEQYLDFSLKHWREHPSLVLRPTFVRWSSSNATVRLRLGKPRRPPVRGKRSIPTILRKKRGLWTIYCALVLPLSQREEKTPQLTITWGYPKELYHCAQ